MLRTPILTEHLRWLLLNISRNLELEKRTDQNFVTQNLLHGKQHCNAKRKLYMNLFWLLRRGGPFFGKQQVVVDVFQLVVCGSRWWCIYFGWWLVVGDGECILAGGGWQWMVVGHGGSWWVVAQFSLTQYIICLCLINNIKSFFASNSSSFVR